jgi:hypothetical protein
VNDSNAAPPRVLYIGGSTRTGSTVLDSLLGSFPGVFSGGELTFFWRYGLSEGGRCSCGQPVVDCVVWSDVLERAFGSETVDADRMIDLRSRFWSAHLPLMVLPSYRRKGLARLEEYPETVERLYHAISASTGARLIIDSSKEPHYSYILREKTDLDVYFLHLVRDPRAVGNSWLRLRPELGFGEDSARALESVGVSGYHHASRRGPVKSSVYFNVSNIAGEMLWRTSDRYAIMRYEDFVARPHETLEAISEFVGVDLDVSSVLDADNSFERPNLHSAWGNPNRFEEGRTTLEPDEAWKTKLSAPNRAILTALNLALLRRYGYPARSRGDIGMLRGRAAKHQLARRT